MQPKTTYEFLAAKKSPHSHSIAVGPCKKKGMEVGGGRPKHFQGALSALVYVYINAYGYITIKVSNYRHLKTRPNESPSSLSLFIFSLLSKILFNDHVKILLPPLFTQNVKCSWRRPWPWGNVFGGFWAHNLQAGLYLKLRHFDTKSSK